MNFNNYTNYLNYARQSLGIDNESAFIAYRTAILLCKDNNKSQLINEYQSFIASYEIDENKLSMTCTDLMVERINGNEYQQTYAILTNLIFDKHLYFRRIFSTTNNILLYILLESSLCEMQHGFEQNDTSMNQFESLEDFHIIYYKLKFLIRRIMFFPVSRQISTAFTSFIKDNHISTDLLAVITKYAVNRSFYQNVFKQINAIMKEHHLPGTELFHTYSDWLNKQLIQSTNKVVNIITSPQKELSVIEISAKDCSQNEYNKELSKNIISVIMCANNNDYVSEVLFYLEHQVIPEYMKLEIIVVKYATSMAAGYNTGMKAAHGRYKFYLHQDTFLLDPDIISKVVHSFKEEPDIGILGIAGAITLPPSGIWWNADSDLHRTCLMQDNMLDIIITVDDNLGNKYSIENVEALDGIFLATSVDLRWRDDLFNGWHFYDISQCQEFLRHGKRVVYWGQSRPIAFHELSMVQYKDPMYDYYRNIFCTEYPFKQNQ